VTFNSVGRATLTFRKAENATWPRLLRSADAKPPNMHTWWAMQSRYEGELKAFDEMVKNGTIRPRKEDNGPAPSPTSDPTTSTPQEQAVEVKPDGSEVDETARALEAAVKALDREELQALSKVDLEGRQRKNALDSDLREKKRAIDAETRTAKTRVREEFAARRQALQSEGGRSAENDGVALPSENEGAQ
jgi:hypothetical protein